MDHRQYAAWGSVSFWKKGTAAEPATADIACLECGAGLNAEKIKFAWPDDAGRLEATKRALDIAMVLGDRAARKSIRDVLGIRERL